MKLLRKLFVSMGENMINRFKKANIKRVFDNAERQGHDRKKLVYINSGRLVDYFFHKETKQEIKVKNISFNNTWSL